MGKEWVVHLGFVVVPTAPTPPLQAFGDPWPPGLQVQRFAGALHGTSCLSHQGELSPQQLPEAPAMFQPRAQKDCVSLSGSWRAIPAMLCFPCYFGHPQRTKRLAPSFQTGAFFNRTQCTSAPPSFPPSRAGLTAPSVASKPQSLSSLGLF